MSPELISNLVFGSLTFIAALVAIWYQVATIGRNSKFIIHPRPGHPNCNIVANPDVESSASGRQ